MELITTDESTVFAKLFLDWIAVEDGQGDRCFPNTTNADESDGCEVFCEIDYFLNKFPTSETSSWRRRRRFSVENTTGT